MHPPAGNDFCQRRRPQTGRAVAHGLPAILSDGTNVAHEFAAKGLAIVATQDLGEDIGQLNQILDDSHLIARCKEALQGRGWDAIARQALAVWSERLRSRSRVD